MISDVIFARALQPAPVLLPRLRARVMLTLVGLVVIACAIASALLISRALEDRSAIRRQALTSAISGANAFDKEVQSLNYLLTGLSKSPALRSGDLQGFSAQLKATPAPEGAWFVLHDLNGRALETSRPLSSKDPPELEQLAGKAALLDRARSRGWTVSGRIQGDAKEASAVAVSLGIGDSSGAVRHFITTIAPDAPLKKILADQSLPRDWRNGVLDDKLRPIVLSGAGKDFSKYLASPALAAALTDAATAPLEGIVEGVDEQWRPVLVAYRYSPATGWTSIVETPLAVVDAPLHRVALEIGEAVLLLLSLGGVAAISLSKQLARPYDHLTRSVSLANRQISQLSEQLLTLQDEERHRIARELHDSTAQHLVASNLNLIRLEKQVVGNAPALETCRRLEDLTDAALRELRVFTYLLHPPDLASEGLKNTLETFIEGFAARSGIAAEARIPQAIDEAPFELQRCILRVVQAALSNVSRHAQASRVTVRLKSDPRLIVVRIADNGRGLPPETSGAEQHSSLGVGIPGMRARLRQFGGELRILDRGAGVVVLAVIPVSAV